MSVARALRCPDASLSRIVKQDHQAHALDRMRTKTVNPITRRDPIDNLACRNRRGAAMLFVVVLLFVASLLMAALVQSVLRQHRQLRLDRVRAQAGWCADAGVQRAIAHLRRNPEFRREVWGIELDRGPNEHSPETAEVQITVEPVGEHLRISTVAEYPVGAVHRVRNRRELLYPVAAPSLSALKPENSQP